MNYQDARPLSTFPRKEREVLEKFQRTENGTDCTFETLNEQAKAIAYKFMDQATSTNHLVRMLDSSIDFRHAVNETDISVLPKSTDAVVRYYNFKNNTKDCE